MATKHEPSLEEVLEHGHPQDAPGSESEKLFVRAMRREEQWGLGNYMVSQIVAQPVTEQEISSVRNMLATSGYADLIELLEAAVAEHDDLQGRIPDTRSAHWSVRAHALLSSVRKPVIFERDAMEPANDLEAIEKIARRDPGVIIAIGIFLGLALLTAIAGMRYL